MQTENGRPLQDAAKAGEETYSKHDFFKARSSVYLERLDDCRCDDWHYRAYTDNNGKINDYTYVYILKVMLTDAIFRGAKAMILASDPKLASRAI